MTWRTVLVRWCFAVVLALAAWAAWIGADQSSRVGVVAPGIDANRVSKLEVRSRDAQSAFAADGLSWSQVTPYACAADALAIRDALDVVATLPAYQSLPVTEVDLDALGLSTPIAEVTLHGDDGARTLALGRRAPAGRAWVKVGDRVISTDDALHALIVSQDPRRWRDPALFAGLSPEIERIELTQGDRTIDLVRQGAAWSMVAPLRTRADPEAVARLIDALGRVRADAFVADIAGDARDALVRFGLDTPAGSVTIHSTRREVNDGAVVATPVEQEVQWGSVVEKGTGLRVGRRLGQGAIVSLDERALVAMAPAPESLIDGRLVSEPTSAVQSIRIDGPGGAFALERREGAWVLGGTGATARPTAVSALLSALTEARATALNEQSAPAELPTTTVTVHGFDGRTLSTLRVVQEGERGRIGVDCGDGLLRIYSDRLHLPLAESEFTRSR